MLRSRDGLSRQEPARASQTPEGRLSPSLDGPLSGWKNQFFPFPTPPVPFVCLRPSCHVSPGPLAPKSTSRVSGKDGERGGEEKEKWHRSKKKNKSGRQFSLGRDSGQRKLEKEGVWEMIYRREYVKSTE